MNPRAILALTQPPQRKLVLIAMAARSGPGGWVQVGINELAHLTGYSVPTVSEAVEALLKLGYVVLSPIEGPRGVARTYRVDGRFLGGVGAG